MTTNQIDAPARTGGTLAAVGAAAPADAETSSAGGLVPAGDGGMGTGVDVGAEAGLRRQLAPWGAMGALVLAAGAARIAMHATGEAAELAYGVAGAAFTIAVVTAWATRRRVTSRRMRHRLVAALTLGATWLSAVTATGLSLDAVAMLAVLGAGLSLLWWKEHRIGPGPLAEPVALIELGGDDLYVIRWATYLGAKGKPLAGSRLVDAQIIKAGYRYVLELMPGTHTVGQVRAMHEALVSGLRLLPGQDVIVEVHPELPAPTAVLTIVTRPLVRKPQLWPGPAAGFDPRTGSVNLGPFVDFEGIGQWSVYKRDGIFGGYLQGAPGSGKSRMIEQIAMSLAGSDSHPTIIWYGDGQNGDSSPLLVEHADYAATSFEAIYNMLSAAVRVMKINGVENRLARRVGFHPTVERPGLVVFLDECHKPLDAAQNPLLAAATQQLCLTIAREGRKVGVALVMASQSPTLDAFGGAGNGADTLRSSLLAGNGVILRSKSKNTKQVFEVDINPSAFPKLPGYAYLCDPDEGARSAPFRGYWVTDDMALTWPQRIHWRTLPPRQANYAGKHYARRHEMAAEQAMQDALLLQLADAGMLADLEDLEQQIAAQGPAPSVDVVDVGGDMHPPVRRVVKFWTIPTDPAAAAVAAAAGSTEQGRPPLTAGQRKVLDAITAGHSSPKEIALATSYSPSQVYNLLGELTGLGRITKTRFGRYEALTTAA